MQISAPATGGAVTTAQLQDSLLRTVKPAVADISVIICTYSEARWADLNAAVASVGASGGAS